MSRKIEILAPGGDIDSIKAAIVAGANAVYCGLNKFNARNRAENITIDDLNGILHLAHQHNCEVFLTLNICIVESEIPDLIRLLNRLVNTSLDGIIIQDLGLFYLLAKYFKSLNVHASTQVTTHNEGQLKFLKSLSASRVNLSRELDINEIKSLSKAAHENKLLTEVFVHGSYCISFSGICYISSVQGGNSGNRGRCSQPCRDEYQTNAQGNSFPLNLKDNSAYFDLQELSDAGVDSLKIEGRMKQFHYVYSVVDAYKRQLQTIYEQSPQSTDNSILYKVFNRNFSNGFLKGDIHKDMFTDNPRDYASTHRALQLGNTSAENIDKAKDELYTEKGQLRTMIKHKTDRLDAGQAPLNIIISGEVGSPLNVHIETPEESFSVHSERNLESQGNMPLSLSMLTKRFKPINDTEYLIQNIKLNDNIEELFIPFKELTDLKTRILFRLRKFKETLAQVELPALRHDTTAAIKSSLSVLIDDPNDILLFKNSNSEVYFQLPNDISTQLSDWITLFQENTDLIPWFPSILLGDHYEAAVEFMKEVQPSKLVTNNTGIAFEAREMGIDWIAGPHLNTMNSYALKCLKETFDCTGAFLSNELNKQQIQNIKKPENFNLHFSIYHPIELMTSRQCFFQTTMGCHKEKMDLDCIQSCTKSTTIKNLKKETLFIDKTKGNFNSIYNETNYLNTNIVADMPNRFASFLIDLRNINTATKANKNKAQVIAQFEDFISGNTKSVAQLHESITPTSFKQYTKGI